MSESERTQATFLRRPRIVRGEDVRWHPPQTKNAAVAELRRIRRRLCVDLWDRCADDADRMAITDAVMVVDYALSQWGMTEE